ncbi:leucine-rich repeat-containing protein 15-like [Fopius arisanus]|uniref:Leucine-rich repeat-containing protein 15-like n=1 Tax=Fopius arisanus TaxID=64838 RepID=A0A9R1T9S6_9HYME|nr:PREDICTED: leucine-rich repeat-containing protein 15-like [Fopius arisanus]
MKRILLKILFLLALSESSYARRKNPDSWGHIISVNSSGALSVKAREGRANRNLDMYVDKISSIPSDAFHNLTSVTSFIIRPRPRRLDLDRIWECNPRTVDITPQSFNGLPSIEYIFIVCVYFQNALKSSEGFDFLRFLLFENNNMTAIPQEFCEDSPKLELLIVRYQRIRYLSPESFSRMNTKVLKQLLLEFNGVEYVEPRTFAKFRQLELLDLSDNNLEILRNGTFEGLDELQKLWVFNNSVNNVEPETFSNLKNLRLLDLRLNRLETLSRGMFDGLSKLERLELFGNPITTITDNSLRVTNQLSHLSLSFGEGIQIEPNAFRGFNLTFFILNADELHHLNAGVFSGCTTECLQLMSNNTINISPNLFKNLTITVGVTIFEPQVSVIDKKSWGLDENVFIKQNPPLYEFASIKGHLY